VLRAIEEKDTTYRPWDFEQLDIMIAYQAKWQFNHKERQDTEQGELEALQRVAEDCAHIETDKYKALYESTVELERGQRVQEDTRSEVEQI